MSKPETAPDTVKLYNVICTYTVEEKCDYPIYAESREQAERIGEKKFLDEHKPICNLQQVGAFECKTPKQ